MAPLLMATDARYPRGAEALLRHHEAERTHPYDDAAPATAFRRGQTLKGFLTAGIGRNLTIVGLRPNEITYLLVNDILDAWHSLVVTIPWIESLDHARQLVLLDMRFNIGPIFLTDGKERLFPAIKNKNYDLASVIMLEWKWAQQVGSRALRDAEMMRTGNLPTDVKGLAA